MKGKKLNGLSGADGSLVWVEFENPDAATCENCGACGAARQANSIYKNGIYRVSGHFLVSPENKNICFHEYIPRITAIYEWKSE